MTDLPHIGPDRSGVVAGGGAFIPASRAHLLVRLLADWRRRAPLGLLPEQVADIEEGIAALRAASNAHSHALSAAATAKASESGPAPLSEEWITTKEAAAITGRSQQWLGQLAKRGVLSVLRPDSRTLHLLKSEVVAYAKAREGGST